MDSGDKMAVLIISMLCSLVAIICISCTVRSMYENNLMYSNGYCEIYEPVTQHTIVTKCQTETNKGV